MKNSKNLLSVVSILALSILILSSCKPRSNDEKHQISKEKTVLQNYVEVPIDRAKDLNKDAQKHNDKIKEALNE